MTNSNTNTNNVNTNTRKVIDYLLTMYRENAKDNKKAEKSVIAFLNAIKIISMVITTLIMIYGLAGVVKYGLPATLVSTSLRLTIWGPVVFVPLSMALIRWIESETRYRTAISGYDKEEVEMARKLYAAMEIMKENGSAR